MIRCFVGAAKPASDTDGAKKDCAEQAGSH